VKIVVDMNLSPEWVQVFAASGWMAQHWSAIGKGDAEDEEIFRWAAANDHVLFTQDLDFPQILFTSQKGKPSVVLLRVNNELDAGQHERVCAILRQSELKLQAGAILVIDEQRIRLRALPIKI
jgi:predicted nuclease of predicted toxin-antitoxin system